MLVAINRSLVHPPNDARENMELGWNDSDR